MTSDVQAARERLRVGLGCWSDSVRIASLREAKMGDIRTILSALTAAEERAATAECERDEARALAAERLRLCIEAVIPVEALRMCGQGYLSDAVWAGILHSSDVVRAEACRAAALTSGADHGG